MYIVVIGGANMDISASSYSSIKLEDSNPGKVTLSPGGVGRNISENLCRLGIETYFITALGDDIYGKAIIDHGRSYGLDFSYSKIINTDNTGLYICINDNQGEMVVSVNAMDICSKIDPELIEEHIDFINNASLVIIDTNLSELTLKYIADNVTAPIACDLVSIIKSYKVIPILDKIELVKANRFEIEAITNHKIVEGEDLNTAAKNVLDKGVKKLIITLGSQGSFYADIKCSGVIPTLDTVVMNTTGCGDSYMAAACARFIYGDDLEHMAKYGVIAASLTASHDGAVLPCLSMDMLNRHIKDI